MVNDFEDGISDPYLSISIVHLHIYCQILINRNLL